MTERLCIIATVSIDEIHDHFLRRVKATRTAGSNAGDL